jgi:oxygen-dependent protoporphyrinogen oxidase
VIAVVGGGIAGLAAAWELSGHSAPAHVVVLEGSGGPGGKIQSAAVGGITVDTGPDAFLARRPEALTLCAELGIADELVAPGTRRAFVWSRGRLRALPDGLALGIPTRLGPVVRSGILSPAGVARAGFDLFGGLWGRRAGSLVPGAGAPDRAVGDIVAERFGREVVDRLVDPLVGGIHAGSVATMSAAAVYPPLAEAAARGGSLLRALRSLTPAPAPADSARPVFLAPRGGVRRVVDALVGALGERGVELRTSTPVTAIERVTDSGDGTDRGAGFVVRTGAGALEADAVVVAVPAGDAAAVLAPLDGAVAGLLSEIRYATVTVVTFVLASSSTGRALDGTGFLVPAVEGWLTTGCTWMSTKWPQLAGPDAVVVRASVGRFGDERAVAMADSELVERVLGELAPVLDLRGAPSASLVTRWPGAFPQYPPGHLDRVDAIDAGVGALGPIAVAGAAYRGVGIPACIASGRRAARLVLGVDGPAPGGAGPGGQQ